MSYSRFAIYYIAPEGALADFGAAWLGWDVVQGSDVDHLHVPGLRDITMTPRKYGFHGTMKPPFALRMGRSLDDLKQATAGLATTLAPAVCDGLELSALGRFLALTPTGDMTALRDVASACVRDLDGFRLPPSADELERRRKANLSARQEELLIEWGYPYVMDQFRFHMTLTGRLPKGEIDGWMETTRAVLPVLPTPFVVDQIALCGERTDGRFELLHRYALTG